MTSESKILTVSYGTFSCTLEGFDDPFNTMKAIAEYFRDLTADDRYFGAEPPQPDAAMLHRIAEREVSRLVTSKSREAGLVLRANADDMEDTGRVTGRPRVTRDVAAPSAPAPAVVEPGLQDVIPSGVSAKLARLRDAVSQPAPGALPNDVLNAFSEDIEDLPSSPEPVQTASAEPVSEPVTVEADAADMHREQDAISRIGALLHDPESQAPDAAPAEEFAASEAFDAVESAADLSGATPDHAPLDIVAEAEAPFIDVDATFADLLPEDAAPARGEDHDVSAAGLDLVGRHHQRRTAVVGERRGGHATVTDRDQLGHSGGRLLLEPAIARTRRSTLKSRRRRSTCEATWSSSAPPTRPGPIRPIEIVCAER